MDGITVVNTIQGICGYGDGTSVGFVLLAFLLFPWLFWQLFVFVL